MVQITSHKLNEVSARLKAACLVIDIKLDVNKKLTTTIWVIRFCFKFTF